MNGGTTYPVWRRFKIASVVCATIAFATFLSVIAYLGTERSISLKQVPITWIIVSGTWLAIFCLAKLVAVWRASMGIRYFPIILLAIVAADATITYAVSQASMISTDAYDLSRWQSLDQRHS